MAQANRLHLDFSLVTNEERAQFLDTYLQRPEFTKFPPTEEELETMANYLLWGKDPKTGLNAKQRGLELKSKHKTWDDSPVDSLEQLMEQPTFNEASLQPLGATRYTTKKEVFSREEALREASPTVRDSFLALFSEIDRLDFLIAQYELNHGKRTKPIRAELVKRFSQEEIAQMQEKVTHWNQYHYLKQRHQLVEMRREQYTLRDSYKKIMFTQNDDAYQEATIIDFDAGVEVLPLGIKYRGILPGVIFRKWDDLNPKSVPVDLLPNISRLYWEKKNFAPSTRQQWFDFRELEHVYQLLNWQIELQDSVERADPESNLGFLLETLAFYVEQAELTDIQREILDMKLRKCKNVDIAWDINHKYGKTYTANYISTIFRQRIIPKINDAARYHEKVISNIFFEEEFKECSTCKRIMLRDPDNFTRKSRANDGLSSRCKSCEKKARQGG